MWDTWRMLRWILCRSLEVISRCWITWWYWHSLDTCLSLKSDLLYIFLNFFHLESGHSREDVEHSTILRGHLPGSFLCVLDDSRFNMKACKWWKTFSCWNTLYYVLEKEENNLYGRFIFIRGFLTFYLGNKMQIYLLKHVPKLSGMPSSLWRFAW